MNYYELLGVKQNATQEEIKKAYKMQMKKWHPDINKTSEAILMSTKINEAKEILLDDKKRKNYDEYITNKVNESYNRYTQNSKNNTNHKSYDNSKDNDMVTKWEYLRQWIKFSTYKPIRKILGTIGVLLESFMCYIIKLILILLAFICNMGSYIIRNIFMYLSPIIGLMLILLIIQFTSAGFKETIKSNKEIIKGVIACTLVYLLSIILPLLSNAILSPKVFDILYNKIDVNLFKKCVGYEE